MRISSGRALNQPVAGNLLVNNGESLKQWPSPAPVSPVWGGSSPADVPVLRSRYNPAHMFVGCLHRLR
jgi:hypothetical protein